MKKRSGIILLSLIGVGAMAVVAVAQTAPPWRRERPSPETMQRLQDGRIAMAVAALKMTEPQLKLWAPVETQVRTNQSARLKAMAAMDERRQASGTRPELPERLEKMSEMMSERAERTKAFVGVFKPFYGALSAEQKSVMGPLLAQLQGERRSHRHGWAMHRGAGPTQQ